MEISGEAPFSSNKTRVKQHRQMLKKCRLLICLWLRCAGWKVVDNGGGGVDALSGTASTIYAMPCKHMNKNVYCINLKKKKNSKKIMK